MEENSYKPERIGKYAAENNRVQGGGGGGGGGDAFRACTLCNR